ncbi:hypothetical protein CTI12_AA577890 [Artemisia annua]|uniref:Zinc knuckle CX2CX4HX4C n=1 Tax=Artemisia annua TaxID=35608 RepID=A0A2U1KPX3_ARTAN|nr:hypothetical protein CTI12_AA577890 [Artemisia annua]
MTDPEPLPPNLNPPPLPVEEGVRTKKANKKSKNDARVSIKLSSEVAKSSHKIKKGSQKNTRGSSSVKSNSSVRSLDDMDEESEAMVEMKDREESIDGVVGTEEGLLAKKPKVSDVVNGEELHEGVKEQNKESVMFPEVEVRNFVHSSVSTVNNNNDSMMNKSYVVQPDMPIPVHENPVLNPNQNKDVQPNNIGGSGNVNGSSTGLVDNLNGSSEVNNGSQGLKYSEYVVGESSMSKDVDMQDTNSSKKPMSFSNVVKGPFGSVNNRLRITTAMCERSNGRANFARVLVEVDATKGIVDSVEVCYRGLGRSMLLKVEYAWRPPICYHCQVFGHNFKECKHRVVTVEETLEAMKTKSHNEVGATNDGKSNDGWQSVQSKRANRTDNESLNMQHEAFPNRNVWNYGRGGTNFRGRGGGYGRGGFNGTRNYNDNRNPVTYNKNNGSGSNNVDSAHATKSNVEVKAKDTSNGKVLPKEILKTRNSFGALNNEDEVGVRNDWQNMKTKIDVACDLGLEIPDDERKNWSKEFQDYYVLKCKELEKSKRRSQLLDRIKSLEKEIVGSNRGIEAVVNKKTESLVTEEMEKTGASRIQAYS